MFYITTDIFSIFKDWGLAEDLVARLATDEKLKKRFTMVSVRTYEIHIIAGPNMKLDFFTQN